MKRKMEFEEFANAVVENISERLPESFQTAKISLQMVMKNNDLRLTGLTIRRDGSNIAPTIYLEQFYEKYKEGADFGDILEEIAEIRVENDAPENFDVSKIMDLPRYKNRIFPKLIGAGWNRDLLEKRPHVMIADLAVTFYIDLGSYGDGNMSIPIHNGLRDAWGVTADELYDIAVSNLSSSGQGTFESINDVIGDLLASLIPDEENCQDENSNDMYVLSNRKRIDGASLLLDKGMMQRVIDRIGEDFYILPSSIHECIILPAIPEMDVAELTAMVREINATQVSVGDRLSDNVYRYTLSEGLKLACPRIAHMN